MITEAKAKQIEFLSNMKQIMNGGHEEYFRERWGDDYEKFIKDLKSTYKNLTENALW